MPTNYANGVGVSSDQLVALMVGGMGVSQGWGATANGTTDDTVRVQKLIDDGQSLYVPANTTLVCSQLNITKPYFKIWGGGRLLLKAGANSPLIFADGTAAANGLHLTIEGVRVDGNKANQTAAAPLVQLRNAAYTRITHSWIVNSAGDGVAVENYGGSSLSDEINIANSFIFSNAGNGARLFSTLSGGLIQATGDHVITHCHINYNGGDGVLLQGAASTLIAKNNLLSNGANGIDGTGINGYLNLSRCIFSDNLSRNNGGSGLYIHADGANGAERIQINGGAFHYNNGAGGGGNGIDVFDTAGLTINGVYSGDADFTFRQLYGIQLARDTNVSVVGCHLLDNVTAGLLPNGVTYKSYGNQGLADTVTSSPSSAPGSAVVTLNGSNQFAIDLSACNGNGGNIRIVLTSASASGSPPATIASIPAPIWTGGTIAEGTTFNLLIDEDSTGGWPAPVFGSGFSADFNGMQIDGTPNTRTSYVIAYHGSVWCLIYSRTGGATS